MHDGRGHSHQYGNGGLYRKGNSMRFATKAAIMGAFAGPAIAALILTGAGPANAAVTTTTTHTTSSSSSPFFPFCSPRHLQRWNLNGYNTVDLSYGTSTYTYSVHFVQRGSCLSGSLTDTGLMPGEQTGPIHGTVVRNQVTFSFTYPTGFQGTRTFTGSIDRRGHVSGTWSETGSEAGSGSWSLAYHLRPACPQFFPWLGFGEFGAGCPVPFPFRFYY